MTAASGRAKFYRTTKSDRPLDAYNEHVSNHFLFSMPSSPASTGSSTR